MDENGRETEKIDIIWNGKLDQVVVQELLEGEYQDILLEVMDTTFINSVPKVRFNIARQKELMLIKGIAKAPFTVNSDAVRKLKIRDAAKLYEVIQRLSGLSEEKKDSSPA
jgi:hypothetical protein